MNPMVRSDPKPWGALVVRNGLSCVAGTTLAAATPRRSNLHGAAQRSP